MTPVGPLLLLSMGCDVSSGRMDVVEYEVELAVCSAAGWPDDGAAASTRLKAPRDAFLSSLDAICAANKFNRRNDDRKSGGPRSTNQNILSFTIPLPSFGS